MFLVKITQEEKPLLLEALHFFGSELEGRISTMGEDSDRESWANAILMIDQVIDVVQESTHRVVVLDPIGLTDQRPVC